MRFALKIPLVVLSAGAWLSAGMPLLAQCAMCRTAAAAQSPEAARALNLAILILLIPAVALFSTVFILSFRYRHSSTSDDERPTAGRRVPG